MPRTRPTAPSCPTPDSPDKFRYWAQPIQLEMRLVSGRSYQIGIRLYYAESPAETAILVW